VLWCVEIRFADRKADNLAPLGFEVPSLLGHSDGGGRLYTGQGVGEEGHGKPPGNHGSPPGDIQTG
jgi:hypothetical protein